MPKNRKNVKNCEIKPFKEQLYRLFLIWKNLPSFLLGMDEEKMRSYGFNEEMMELLKIKNHIQFAEKYNLHINTLTNWAHAPIPKEFKDIDWKIWAKKGTKNVIGALYRKVLIEADASRVKLWLQVVEDWVEKSEQDVKPISPMVVLDGRHGNKTTEKL